MAALNPNFWPFGCSSRLDGLNFQGGWRSPMTDERLINSISFRSGYQRLRTGLQRHQLPILSLCRPGRSGKNTPRPILNRAPIRVPAHTFGVYYRRTDLPLQYRARFIQHGVNLTPRFTRYMAVRIYRRSWPQLIRKCGVSRGKPIMIV